MTMISEDLPADTDLGVRVTAINPPESGTTGTFTV